MNLMPELIGVSPAIKAVREQIGRLLQRQTDLRRLPPVLMQGETGTGKGLLARILHGASPRAEGPFVDVNCAAIPETLLEAEMFGFERGAFTDARQAKPGLFQAAHRGTIFLDELSLLPQGLQAKLLKAIEERAVRRLGSTRSEPVDAWVLTATSEDLVAAARAGRFREDLYHRLAVVIVSLPPLRGRGQDILLLAEHFLARACADYDLPPKTLASDAREALLAYPWPGNVRELANVMERVALLAEAQLVTGEVLGLPEVSPAKARAAAPGETGLRLEDAVGSVEREHLLEALHQTGWNVTRAAARLGISRDTLRYRMTKHGLRPGAAPPPARRSAPAPRAPRPAVPAAGPPGGAAPSTVRWERRRLTLLRVALVVPPAADPRLHPSRALEAVVENVQSFGGRAEELSPTGLVAAFGLEPVEDAPRRAAHAAMAIAKSAERAQRGQAEGWAVKVGIHVGQFLVGQGSGAATIDLEGKREAGAVLDALVGRAGPNSILVSAASAPFLERRFELVAVGPAEGMPERAYRLVGRERTGLGLSGRMTRFVGRRQELDLLRGQLASAQRGHGQAVGIVGEAGVGKSRLLFEFRQGLAGERVTHLEGRCLSYGSAIPYLPVVEIVRNNCGIAEADTPEAMTEKVRRGLAELGVEPEERGPYLLQLLGVKEGTERLAVMSPEAIKAQTLETLRQMIIEGCDRRPIIFVVEDLHWIDKTSEECVAALVEYLPAVPILFLGTYRPGYRPPWMERSYATQIALQPLSPQESLSVLHSVLQTEAIPDHLAQLILAKAEGNPFFLEELTRVMREQGDLRPPPAVPDTIQEVLLARIDRLPDEARQLLQTAAVLGREVSTRLLGAIWDGPGDLAAHLRELTRLEFLYERGGADEPAYVFKHALTQEVAYASLPPAQRQVIHAAAGRALKALYADRLEAVYDRLAYHYARTDAADQAVEYLTRFAEKAIHGHAHAEAVRALEEALPHAERLPAEERDGRLLDLVLRQASSLIPLGRFPETLNLLLRQRDRLERIQDASLIGRYHFLMGLTYSFLGDHARTVESAQQAIGEAGRADDKATMGKAYCLLAFEGPLSGQSSRGIEYARQAVELLQRTKEPWWLGQAHWLAGLNHTQMGEFELAMEALARAHALAEAMDDPRLQTSVAWVTGVINAARGEWEAGIQACQRGLERSPDPLNTAITLGWLGYAYLEQGDPGQAIPVLERAVQQVGQFRFRHFQSLFTVFLAEAHRLNQEIDKAHALAREGLEIAKGANFSAGVGWAHHALGRIAQVRGALPEAEAHLNEARETFAAIQSRYELGRTHLDLAALAHLDRRPAAAATHLGEALALFTASQIPTYVDRARRLAAELAIPLADDLAP